jgi:uncharacterized protein with beta-barrel porin domain
MAGGDWNLGSYRLGFSVAWMEAWIANEFGSTSTASTYRGAGYLSVDRNNWYLDAAAGLAYVDLSYRRPVDVTVVDLEAQADTHAMEYLAMVGGGYRCDIGFWDISFDGRFQYVTLETQAFTESGAGTLNLQVNSGSYDSFLSQLTAGAGYTWPVSLGGSLWNLRAGGTLRWEHEWLDDPHTIEAQLATFGGDMSDEGLDPIEDRVQGRFSVELSKFGLGLYAAVESGYSDEGWDQFSASAGLAARF